MPVPDLSPSPTTSADTEHDSSVDEASPIGTVHGPAAAEETTLAPALAERSFIAEDGSCLAAYSGTCLKLLEARLTLASARLEQQARKNVDEKFGEIEEVESVVKESDVESVKRESNVEMIENVEERNLVVRESIMAQMLKLEVLRTGSERAKRYKAEIERMRAEEAIREVYRRRGSGGEWKSDPVVIGGS